MTVFANVVSIALNTARGNRKEMLKTTLETELLPVVFYPN